MASSIFSTEPFQSEIFATRLVPYIMYYKTTINQQEENSKLWPWKW